MKRTTVEVNKHRIELSNLEKVLFPDEGIIKAELIQYYLTVAPTMLRYIKGRPLSLVRYPDGITGEAFFQKQRPDWTPDWIAHTRLGDEKTDYLLASREADLVWLANLACIELHQTNARAPRFEKPDYMAFDLDPPESFEFKRTIEIALQLKEHLAGYSYHPFAKTSGGSCFGGRGGAGRRSTREHPEGPAAAGKCAREQAGSSKEPCRGCRTFQTHRSKKVTGA